jgi:hypothetical protein
MSDLLEGISQYIIGYQQPKKNDLVKLTDKIMDSTVKMESFLNNIDDDRKREVMKRNVSMIQQMLVDNLEIYNEWLDKQ